MQLCLSTEDESEAPLQEQVRAASEAGFRCLDVSLAALDGYLASYPSVVLVALLQEHELYVGMVSGLPPLALGERGAADVPPGARTPNEPPLLIRARLLALCAELDALGGGTVLLPLPSLPSAGEARSAILERMLRSLADVAAPFDARLAITPRRGPDGTAPPLADVAALVEHVGRPNLGLGLELAGSDLPGQIPAAFTARLWAVRLGVAAEGGRTSQLRALCAQLAAAGYRGPYSVAPAPVAPTLSERARLAVQALRVLESR